MPNDAVLMINSDFGRRASERVDGLENKVKASMKAVLDENWLVVNDDDALFRAGLGGVLLDVGQDSEDGQKLTASIDVLKKFGSFLSASSAGLSVEFPEMPDPETILPLMGWWREIKGDGK